MSVASRERAVAIVGAGGFFPGAPTLERFWELIERGESAASEPPPGRWAIPVERAHGSGPDRVLSRRACFVGEPPLSLDGLAVSAEDVRALDPTVRLALFACRQAWESCAAARVDRSRAGVILGSIALPTEATSRLAWEGAGRAFESRVLGGDDHERERETDRRGRFATGLPAGIVARALGFGGTTLTLDAACASSLYAVKLACDELREGRLDLVIAGGLARPDALYTQMGFSALRALSPSGRCAPFDRRGDGLVVGEGAGAVVLKRLEDAIAHGDRIRAVVRGAGLSNDVEGRLLAPSSEGQLRAMRAAYEEAGLSPSEIDLVECHATGTPVGDAVELASLALLLEGRGRCAIGSVKSNVGHLLTGAGAAGLIKVLLALEKGVLPPTAHFEAPAAGSPLEKGPLRVLSRAEAWPRRDGAPRRAAVSGFGFGGINAHVVLEEWIPSDVRGGPEAHPTNDGVAIVGMAARFGGVPSLAALERRVFRGGASLEGRRLEDVPVPARRFRIPPAELAEMLPQQLVLLDAARAAVDDCVAGAPANALRTGVFAGLGLDPATSRWHLRWTALERGPSWARALGLDPAEPEVAAWLSRTADALQPPLDADRTVGALGGIAASRVARELRAGGPSFVLGTEETSGLSALEAALRALRRGEIDRAVVCAVEIADDARGLERGAAEGAAAVVLRRLEDAVRDGERVRAVVRGAGSAVGSLAAAEARAGAEAGCPSAHPDRSEPAGRAESKGPIHLDAMSDIGRAGAASGLASVVKAALCLERRVLPSSGSACERAPAPRAWLRDRVDGPRRALVSGASSDGKAAAVVLEEHEAAALDAASVLPREEGLFVLEADDRAGLAAACADLEASLAPSMDVDAAARCWLARAEARPSAARALAIVARSVEEARRLASLAGAALRDPSRGDDALAEHLASASAGRIVAPGARPLGREGHVAFVYPGSGNHFPGMGREHALLFGEALRAHGAASARLASQLLPSLAWDASEEAMAGDPRGLLLAQVSLGALLTDGVRGLGVAPGAAIGYSLGESTALVALGAWRGRDALLERVMGSTLFTEEMAGPCRAAARAWGLPEGARAGWVMGALERPAAEVRRALEGRARAYLLIVNTPAECIVGGERDAVLRLAADLGAPLRPLPGVTAVHCEVARPVAEAYRALHTLETTPPAGVRFYSGASGEPYEPTSERAAGAVLAQALHGVDFPATVECAYGDGARIFLELGPGNSCARMIGRILEGRPHAARALCVRGQGAWASLLRAAAMLVAERVPGVELRKLYPAGHEEVANTEAATLFRVKRPPFQEPPAPPPPHSAHPLPSAHPERRDGEAVAESKGRSTAGAGTWHAPALLRQLASAHAARTSAEAAFLRLSSGAATAVAERIAFQMDAVALGGGAAWSAASPGAAPRPAPSRQRASHRPFLDRAGCLEFATGSIARALGPAFAEIDALPTRVRLPDEPLMLCDRIVSVDAEPLSMRPGSLVTEHDVTADRWYLDAGRIPTGVAVESGQADLFLSGYLGIDRETRGLAVYRLLDAVVTFHAPLPRPGDVIRYAISITELFRHGPSWFFRFRFDATVAGAPLMSMREGLAGFFTAGELAAGKGVVRSRLDERAREGKRPADWRALAPLSLPSDHPERGEGEALAELKGDARLDALRAGDLAACFGPAFARRGPRRPLTLPGERRPLADPLRRKAPPAGKLDLLDRVRRLSLEGGRYGLGSIEAEADIRPDAWFLTCHFVDDRVMPGTLMYECCMHALRVLLLRLGWIGEEGRAAVEPVPGVASRLKCRGQVVESTRRVVYEVHLKELGYAGDGAPFAIADAVIHADGKAIVDIADMSARVSGLTRSEVEAIWSPGEQAGPSTSDALRASCAHGDRREGPGTPAYDRASIVAFAEGNPSEAFGAPYRIFDAGAGRKIARLPRDPFRLLDRIVSVTGDPFRFEAGGTVEAEVDLATAAWTFAANRQEEIPFAALLEIALQPCGWLAAYVGSALTSEADMRFRNLGGQASLRRPVRLDAPGGKLAIRVRMTSLSKSGDSIIQRFDFAVRDALGTVYEGDTYFGFHTAAALENQVGLRGARLHAQGDAERARSLARPFPEGAPFPDERLRMIDRIVALDLDGGPHGLGFIEGRKLVRPEEWFFEAHFFEDPVWPGSLGLEAFLQLARALAAERWGASEGTRLGTIAPGTRHAWTYRGQVIPRDREVAVQAFATARDDAARRLTAAGFLSVDGRAIYEMKGFTVEVLS